MVVTLSSVDKHFCDSSLQTALIRFLTFSAKDRNLEISMFSVVTVTLGVSFIVWISLVSGFGQSPSFGVPMHWASPQVTLTTFLRPLTLVLLLHPDAGHESTMIMYIRSRGTMRECQVVGEGEVLFLFFNLSAHLIIGGVERSMMLVQIMPWPLLSKLYTVVSWIS